VAGFSGVVTAFTKRPGKLSAVEAYRLAVLLGITFGAVFLALLPVVLGQFGVAGERLWATVSSLMAVYSTVALAVFLYSSRLMHRLAPEIFNLYLMSAMAAGHAVNIVLQVVNALHPGAAHAAAIYTVGLCWYLVHAAVQFSRMLFVQPADC
jgi:hypothetical protein